MLRHLKILFPLLFSPAFLRKPCQRSSLSKASLFLHPLLRPWGILFAKNFGHSSPLPCATEDSCPICMQASLRSPQTDHSFDSIHLNMRWTFKENDKPSPSFSAFPKLSANSWGSFCSHAYLSLLNFCFPDFSVMHLSAPLCSSPSVYCLSPCWTGPRFLHSFQSTITPWLLLCDRLVLKVCSHWGRVGQRRDCSLGKHSTRNTLNWNIHHLVSPCPLAHTSPEMSTVPLSS